MPVIRKDFGHPCFLVIHLLGLGTNPSPIPIKPMANRTFVTIIYELFTVP